MSGPGVYDSPAADVESTSVPGRNEDIINLYGRGILIFGWDKKKKLETLYEKFSEYANPELLESISYFIFEMDAPIAEAEKRFVNSFEKNKNIITWQELNHFYIRHRKWLEEDTVA